DRGVPALPLGRRLVGEGARAPLVPRRVDAARLEGGHPPRPRRHPRERVGDAPLPRARVLVARGGRRAARRDARRRGRSRRRRPAGLTPGAAVWKAGSMRAVVVEGYGGPEVLSVIEVPDPVPGPDEILIRVA